MDNHRLQLSERYRLRSLKAAKVSEISETTAASAVPAEERVNFHIGHPVQEPELITHYQELVTGLPVTHPEPTQDQLQKLIAESPWEESETSAVRMVLQAVRKSVPYLPRGGFSSRNPSKLARLVHRWLIEFQQDPLEYDLGEESGRRELIFTSGGTAEFLRVFFHALEEALIQLPAEILTYRLSIPADCISTDSVHVRSLERFGDTLVQAIRTISAEVQDSPVFLMLGEIPDETQRRSLRRLSQESPLFFVEVNNAPNHLSMAREAGMYNRVLRCLTPGAIDPAFGELPITTVVGNAEYLRIIETIHFQLKSNPPAADAELFTYLLEQKLENSQSDDPPERGGVPDPDEFDKSSPDPGTKFERPGRIAERLLQRIEYQLSRKIHPVQKQAERISRRAERLPTEIPFATSFSGGASDPLAGMDRREVIRAFLSNYHNPDWLAHLESAFLSTFTDHHPEYKSDSCLVVSGSSRTALSLLGFSCGIREVIVPDLSWTYEHCFPSVEAVNLGAEQSLDVEAITQRIRRKLESDPGWNDYGAVVLNNPHNASGQIFDDTRVERLLYWLLEHEVYVIDDLAYQNVIPKDHLRGPRTCKQIVRDMVRGGQLRRRQARRLITVHSLSKTDCFAGSRLAVAEIPDQTLYRKFHRCNARITTNHMAVLLAYLFYKNPVSRVEGFWRHRNRIFENRLAALHRALDELAEERNPFDLTIRPPAGAMYPQLMVKELPPGISLDWLSSGLATRGIGLVPLSTFARTSTGYRLARRAFRLTLGGSDNAETMHRKARRVLIDLNRLITEEASRYNRQLPPSRTGYTSAPKSLENARERWEKLTDLLRKRTQQHITRLRREDQIFTNPAQTSREFLEEYLPERIEFMENRFRDRLGLAEQVLQVADGSGRENLMEILQGELSTGGLQEREERFRHRLFDRTVHPTQMYSLTVEKRTDQLIEHLLYDKPITHRSIDRQALDLIREFYGRNVLIRSIDEPDELTIDLQVLIDSEIWANWWYDSTPPSLLSFWGDWDGSTRPSGQGHRLAAGAVSANVERLSRLIQTLLKHEIPIDIDDDLLNEIQKLEEINRDFWNLLNKITSLTNQLENRYQRVLPFGVEPGILRKIGMKLGLARDPVAALWQHNDRLERRMLNLRSERREQLEHYFQLNNRLTQSIAENLHAISDALHIPAVALRTGLYRNLLKRFALTPRIHQKMILSQDQFAIDTTVYNIMEINEIAGKNGAPGIVEALQVSMSTDPEAFISLERKLRSRREEVLRQTGDIPLPSVWVIPLFEGTEIVHNLEEYLDRVWEFAAQSRQLDQTERERFSEMVCELFFAGSDLSQQVSQAAGDALYREAKHRSIRWLARKGLAGDVRIKLGSGEPMQRQGGYYDPQAGKAVVRSTQAAEERLRNNVDEATHESVSFARSPLRGVWSSGEFRTFQSNIFEHLRRILTRDRAELFHHISEVQRTYEQEITRASEPLVETRLPYERRGFQELEMLTLGRQDDLYEEFINYVTENFQQILYGREEDVVGIHVISYFIARTSPPLRDRPVVRPSQGSGEQRGQQIVERIAQILPLRHHGSLLRAIGHNRSQTMVLGVNQLTTGLFRALRQFADSRSSRSEATALIRDRILPRLPVQDILHTLRIYQDLDLRWIKALEEIFPANNSALLALREDTESIRLFSAHMQRELLRRHGLDPDAFFQNHQIKGELLPVLRPELAVLLQPDVFNTSVDRLLEFTGEIRDEEWLDSMRELLEIPETISRLRDQIWNLIQAPIRQQVSSFVELSLAISRISADEQAGEIPIAAESEQVTRVGSQVAEMLRGVVDDSMRQFLIAVVQYLTRIPETTSEVPIDVLRALRDVERIVKIEEQALGAEDQDKLRYYLLQIARRAKENG